MRSSLRAVNFIGATILTALLSVSIAAGQTRISPGATVAPHTLTFPPQIVGTRSAAKTTPYRLRISVTTSAPFQSAPGCVLLPHKSCTIPVTFAPVVVGPANGVIVANAIFGLLHETWTLSGTGVTSMAGQPDILWWNQSTGGVALWLMNGNQYASASWVGTADPAWRVVAIGDFTRDGKADLVWQSSSTGGVALWKWNGTSYAGAFWLGTAPLGWRIVAAGDMTADGWPDLLWQNPTTGQLALWRMQGTQYVSAQILPSVDDPNWKVAALADFNQDGELDILWRNESTGGTAIWLMNGTSYEGSAWLGIIDLQWQVATVADYSGDGKVDILWRNISNGSCTLWVMNGTQYGSSLPMPSVSDLNWKIVGQP
jgi:hypothetical protein